jgi:hypothetical protein
MRIHFSGSSESLLRRVERREWVLWSFAILVTLLLTAGLASFIFPMLHNRAEEFDTLHLNLAVRGLVGLVLLFDIYTVYQQLQIFRIRHELVRREELFRLISENAADMIAVVDGMENVSITAPPTSEFSVTQPKNFKAPRLSIRFTLTTAISSKKRPERRARRESAAPFSTGCATRTALGTSWNPAQAVCLTRMGRWKSSSL